MNPTHLFSRNFPLFLAISSSQTRLSNIDIFAKKASTIPEASLCPIKFGLRFFNYAVAFDYEPFHRVGVVVDARIGDERRFYPDVVCYASVLGIVDVKRRPVRVGRHALGGVFKSVVFEGDVAARRYQRYQPERVFEGVVFKEHVRDYRVARLFEGGVAAQVGSYKDVARLALVFSVAYVDAVELAVAYNDVPSVFLTGIII